VPHSFAGERPEVRNEAKGQTVDKLSEIWDQLTRIQRSCPVDSKGDMKPVHSGLTLNCRARELSAYDELIDKAHELRNQNTERSPKRTPTRPTPSGVVESLLRTKFVGSPE
jgi:hypothetical protein